MSLKFVEELHKMAINAMNANEVYAVKIAKAVEELLNKIDFNTHVSDDNIASFVFPDDRVIEVFIKPSLIAQDFDGTSATSASINTVTIAKAIKLRSICKLIEKQLQLDDYTRQFHAEAFSSHKGEHTNDVYSILKLNTQYLKIWFNF